MANRNDTKTARLTEGCDLYGRIGSPSRNRPASKFGPLGYSLERLNADQRDWYRRNTEPLDKLDDKGRARNQALKFGLPKVIKGNPLGCRCNEAFLVGATKPVGSHIEADYMCDVGYHNYVVFELIGFENKGEAVLKVDSHGNLVEDTAQAPRELGGL